jgi:histidine ammonia-lyase
MAAPAVLLALATFGPAAAAPYRAITPQPTQTADQTVTLTGHDLTVEQVVAVARYGQSVEVSAEAARHQDDAHNLLLEGAAEGIAIAGLNRGGDSGGTILFDGDPAAPENQAANQQRALAAFQSGALFSGPEITDEEAVRAMMVVRANTLAYAPASAPVTQMLLDFLNNRITPVVGASTNPLAGVAAAMVGKGDAYYHGIRMPAAQALTQAGLMPVTPVDADYGAFTETGAYETGRTALLVGDGRLALEWSDLIYAMDLNGMNAGIAPLALPAQANRPFKWIYWDAARVLDMIKGSFLFDEDPVTAGPRPYPANLSLSLTRQGAAWRAWGDLRDVVLIALNSSDQAWAIRVGLSPRESPELGTPQMMKYYVKGGKNSGGKRGFVAPALNRDPYPLANDVAAFASAISMLDAALAQRIAAPPPGAPQAAGDGPVPLNHARQVLDGTFSLLAVDLADAAKLLDQRAAENTVRTFGTAPTAAWMAFRTAVSAQTAGDAAQAAAWQFIQGNLPAIFYPKGEPPLGTDDPIPLAQEKIR